MTLVIYFSKSPLSKQQRTVQNHILSFINIDKEVVFYNMFPHFKIKNYLINQNFNFIVFHYTFLALSVTDPKILLRVGKKLSNLKGIKIAFPQDEYTNSNTLCEFFKLTNTDKIFTLLNKIDFEKVYPKHKSGVSKIFTVLPGYVSENDLKYIKKKPKNKTIDISYRSRKTSPWLGKHSFLKWMIAEKFKKVKLKNLKIDISVSDNDRISGDDWLDFLCKSRTVLGVEGGSSIHDPDGVLQYDYESYLKNENPKISHHEYYNMFLKKYEGNLNLKCLTPRIFEAIMCKCCLVLVEGNYSGILKKDINYIPVNKDFSNIDEVLNKICDKSYCDEIVNRNYKMIIKDKKYSYKSFIDYVVKVCKIKQSKMNFSNYFKNYHLVNNFSNNLLVLIYYYAEKLMLLKLLRIIKTRIK